MRPVPLVSGWNLLPFIQFLDGIGAPVAWIRQPLAQLRWVN